LRKDESFGVIPLTKRNGKWEVFLIQHNRNGYWGFPKGHAEAGETPMQAAFRELKEETNLDCKLLLVKEGLLEQYTFIVEKKRVFKQVLYFIAEVEGEPKLQSQEIHDGKWLPMAQAFQQLTHQEGKDLLAKVEKVLPKI
jgi:bis(5'-nucleosidyl)-tetraphosphatase